MNTKTFIIGLFVLIIIAGGVYFVSRSSSESASSITDTSNSSVNDTLSTGTSNGTGSAASEIVNQNGSGTAGAVNTESNSVKSFEITGQNFSFSPKEIRVKKGDTVKITFKNVGGMHDWVIDEFKAKTSRIKDGETADVQFLADKSGTYEYYCSVGSHRQMGMVGKLIVE